MRLQNFSRCKMVTKTFSEKGVNSLVRLTEVNSTFLLKWLGALIFKISIGICDDEVTLILRFIDLSIIPISSPHTNETRVF